MTRQPRGLATLVAGGFVLLSGIGCQNALDQRLSLVGDARVLAIAAEPAEVKPGANVAFTPLVGDRDGSIAVAMNWAWCAAPKPPTEDNAVAAGCLANQVTPLGDAPAITAAVPIDACRTFGPDVVSPGFRPRDPDPSGGYYQPVRGSADISVANAAFGFARITCNLANAPVAIAQAYKDRYVANANPSLEPLTIDGVANAIEVARDSDVTLVAAWPATAAEDYVYYDANAQRLITRRETMRVSWFATGGELAADATSVDETDTQTSAVTTWHTPDSPGVATLWLVLRDSRGGLATQTIGVSVR